MNGKKFNPIMIGMSEYMMLGAQKVAKAVAMATNMSIPFLDLANAINKAATSMHFAAINSKLFYKQLKKTAMAKKTRIPRKLKKKLKR